MPAIAEKMKSLEDPALRAAMAFDLFGKSGIQMVPILEKGAAAVEEWRNKARLTDEDIRATIEAGNALKVAASWAEVLAAKLINAVSALRLLHNEQGGKVDFGSSEFQAFRASYYAQHKMAALAAAGLTAIPGAGLAASAGTEARIRELYSKIVTGNDPEAPSIDGKEGASDRLNKSRQARAEKSRDESQRLDALREKYEKLSTEYGKLTDKESEGAINAQTEMEAVKADIDDILKKAAEQSQKADELSEKEITANERIAQLKEKILQLDGELATNSFNEVEVSKKKEERARALNELKEKEASLSEKKQKAEQTANEKQAEFERKQQERNAFTLGQLAGEGMDDYDPAAGVRGSRHRKLARRAYNRFLNNLSPDERAARGLAQDIQGAESDADYMTRAGHFSDAQQFRMEADELRRQFKDQFPDWAGADMDPLREQREAVTKAMKAVQDLIDGKNKIPVSVENAGK